MASAFRILGEGQLSLTKFLLVTDRLVDLKDFRATLEHVLARTNPQTDLYVFSNLSMDTLDYTGPGRERGLEGRVARARRSGARAAARVSRRRCRRRRTSPTCACSAAAVSSSARRRSPTIRDARGADRRASGVRRLAADRRQRRAGARDAQRR